MNASEPHPHEEGTPAKSSRDLETSDQGLARARNQGLARARRIAAYGTAVLFGPLFVGLVWLIISQASRLPALTPADFRAARQLWREQGPASYRIEVTVRGRQPATYRVEVRDGEVTSASRNDKPLTQRRTMGTWSVPGMFGTMETDVERIAREAAGESSPGLPPLVLRAKFDSQLGYPARYHRIENVRYGANPEVSWEVTRFETLGESNGASP